jgi:uncharacterized protein (DUF736 family)
MSYDNTNTGAIFKNDKKADNHPDYKGKINVDGVDKEIALWVKTSKDGTKNFLSAKISAPFVKDEIQSTSTKIEESVNDLPF